MNHHSTTANNMHHQNPNQTFGEHPASGPAPTTAGHHKHDILNKLDPRVDSTMDHQPIATMAATGEGAFSRGLHELHQQHYPQESHHSTTGMGPSMHGAADPSSSSHHIGTGSKYDSTCYNKRARMNDPNADVPVPPKDHHHKHRAGFHHGVDVATNSSTVTAAGQGHGLGGVGAHPTHDQKMMGSPTSTSAPLPGALPGPALNTAGPHHSDLMNKLDPRVDSHGGHWAKY